MSRHLEALSDDLGNASISLKGRSIAWQASSSSSTPPSSCRRILFEKLGLAKGRKTKTGYSTDAATLATLAEKHEIVHNCCCTAN